MVIDPRTALAESVTSSTRIRQARRVLDHLGVRRLVPIPVGASPGMVSA
jgi:hypothetical protein